MKQHRAWTIGVVLALAGLWSSHVSAAQPGTYFASYYTNAWGTRYFQGYVPTTYNGSPMPLVVALHGCTQNAAIFQALTRFDAKAQEKGFIVVFPEQAYAANGYYCWNWTVGYNQVRDSGEASIISGITNTVRANYNIDPQRIYVTGLSAGGAETVILGATYPDLFASIAPHSGCGYLGSPCGTAGGPDPTWAGNQIYTAQGGYKRVVPTMVFIGSADNVTPPINSHQILTEWAQANDRVSDGLDNNNIDDIAEQTVNGQVLGGRSYTRYIYNNATSGQPVMEKYVVNGMSHAWSGGCSCQLYSDPSGPDATSIIYDFFVAHPKP